MRSRTKERGQVKEEEFFSDDSEVDGGNATAQAFGCFWNATHEEGRPLCGQYCSCQERCVEEHCTDTLHTLNTFYIYYVRIFHPGFGSQTFGDLPVEDQIRVEYHDGQLVPTCQVDCCTVPQQGLQGP